MSMFVKLLALVGIVIVVAACSQKSQEEYVVVPTDEVSQEPVFTGKYK